MPRAQLIGGPLHGRSGPYKGEEWIFGAEPEDWPKLLDSSETPKRAHCYVRLYVWLDWVPYIYKGVFDEQDLPDRGAKRSDD